MGCSASVFGNTACPPIKNDNRSPPRMRSSQTSAKAKSAKIYKKSAEKARTTTTTEPGLTQVSDMKCNTTAGTQSQKKSNRLKSPVQPAKNKKFKPVPPEMAVKQKSLNKVNETEPSEKSSCEKPRNEHIGVNSRASAAMPDSGGVSSFTGKQMMNTNANVQVSSTERSTVLSQKSTLKKVDDSLMTSSESPNLVSEDVTKGEIKNTGIFDELSRETANSAHVLAANPDEVVQERKHHEPDHSMLPDYADKGTDDEDLLEKTSFEAATSAILTAVESLKEAHYVMSHEYNQPVTYASAIAESAVVPSSRRGSSQVEIDEILEMTSEAAVTSAISIAVKSLIDSQGAGEATDSSSTTVCLETTAKADENDQTEDVEAHETSSEVIENELCKEETEVIVKYGADIVNNEGDVTNNETDMNNEDDIMKNQDDVTSNKTDVMNNEADVVNSEDDVMKNQDDVVNSEADVTNNKADVMNNKADVINTEGDVMNNEFDVMNNEGVIEHTKLSTLLVAECCEIHDKDDSTGSARRVSSESTEEQDSETQLSTAIADILRSDTGLIKTPSLSSPNETGKTKETGSSSRNSIKDMASGNCIETEMEAAQSFLS